MPKFKVTSVEFLPCPVPDKMVLEPPFLPVPTDVARLLRKNLMKKAAVKRAIRNVKNARPVSASTPQLASARLWPTVAEPLSKAMSGTMTVALDPPRYVRDEDTGEHIITGWLLEQGVGTTSPYRTKVKISKKLNIEAYVSVVARVGKPKHY